MALGVFGLFLLQASKYSTVGGPSPVTCPQPLTLPTQCQNEIQHRFPYEISKNGSGIWGQVSDHLVISLGTLNSIKYYQTAIHLKKPV